MDLILGLNTLFLLIHGKGNTNVVYTGGQSGDSSAFVKDTQHNNNRIV